MAMGGLSPDHYILSHPIRLRWAGWETNTHALQAAGWSLSAEQDPYSQTLRIAMEYKYGTERAVHGITQTLPFDYYKHARTHMAAMDSVCLHANLANDLWIVLSEPKPLQFRPIDATPQLAMGARTKIQDLVHFAPILTRTQEIIIPEPSVAELLEKIVKMQEPARNEHFKRIVKQERYEGLAPRQKVHAQIISLAS